MVVVVVVIVVGTEIGTLTYDMCTFVGKKN